MAAARVQLRQLRRRLAWLLRKTRQLKPVLLLRLACLSNAGSPSFSRQVVRKLFGQLIRRIHVGLSVTL